MIKEDAREQPAAAAAYPLINVPSDQLQRALSKRRQASTP